MAEEVKTKPIALGIGIFILLALVGTTYLIADDNAYMCNDNNLLKVVLNGVYGFFKFLYAGTVLSAETFINY